MVAGKDPAEEPEGGHSSYVLAHAHAAFAAGWHPLLVAVGTDAARRATDVGTVLRFRTPYRPVRQLAAGGHARVLVQGILGELSGRPGPVLLHAFGVWGLAAVMARDRLRTEGRAAAAAVSSYTVYRVEHESLVRGGGAEPWAERARYRTEALWARCVVDRWEAQGYRSADRVWVNYESVRHLIEAHHGSGVHVERLPYGPVSGFSPLVPPTDLAVPAEVAALSPAHAPLVVCVARHHSRKGVDVLIEALARVRDAGVDVRAALVGPGPLLDAHRRLVAARRLTDRVAVPGPVEEIDPYLAAADVVVQPSREEQSGALAVLEALRRGRPVVASAVDGLREDLTDGETGILVPPDDPCALGSSLARLACHPDERARLGRAGQILFTERFGPDRFVEGLAAAYADLGFPHP